jgi:AsmA protein
MKKPSMRSGLILTLCLIAFCVILVAALPLLVSTAPIKLRIANELSSKIGYRIDLRGNTEVSVFPVLRARLHDVVVSDWRDPRARPLVEAAIVDVDLLATDALRGKLSMTAVTLLRPVLRLNNLSSANDKSRGFGAFGGHIERVRAILAENPAEPDLSKLPSDALGRLTITDGTVMLGDTNEAGEAISAVDGTIIWMALNRPAEIALSGTWDADKVSVSSVIESPLLLLAGGPSKVETSINSPKLTFRYGGTAGVAGSSPFAEGNVAASTPSLAEFLRWARLDFSFGAESGPAAFSGNINGNSRGFSLGEATVELDGNPASGAIEFTFADGMPQVSGSLDFQTLDLSSILTAFVPLPYGSGIDRPIDTRFIRELGLDMRLSARTARAGSLRLSNVAASLQIKGDVGAFDVNEADLYSGKAQAGLRLDIRDAVPKGEFRLGIENMVTGEFAQDIGMIRVEPRFPGSLSILARGNLESWRKMMQTAEGTFLFRGGEGQIAGLNWSDFTGRTNSNDVFGLWVVPEGQFPVTATHFEGKIQTGDLRVSDGRISTATQDITLRGVMPYVDKTLALFGALKASGAADTARGRNFFVGGSWYNPYISPILE